MTRKDPEAPIRHILDGVIAVCIAAGAFAWWMGEHSPRQTRVAIPEMIPVAAAQTSGGDGV